ncbi:MAG: conjugal transfer protein TraF [Gallionellaceae bacterium]
MSQKDFRLATLTTALLMLSGTAAQALPFNSFDPRTMAMGGAGVAVGDPATAPLFNPALLSASDPDKLYSIELPVIGGRLYDPGNLRSELPTLSDNATLLTNSVTPLSSSATTLGTDTTTLTTSITSLSTSVTSLAAITVTDAATAATASTALSGLATSLTTVSGDMTTVSTDMSTVSTNSTSVATNINAVNQSLQTINNQPLQGEFGAAVVVAVPNKNWGVSFYSTAWGAMGGSLVYKDATTVSNISGAVTATAAALATSSTATGTSATAIATAVTDVNTAVTNCSTATLTAGTVIQQATALTTCVSSLATANTSLGAAQTDLNSTSTTLTTNATDVSNQAATVTNNKTVLSQVHLRGVAVTETGFALSHSFISYDQAWAVGITPKIMQLQLFDAYLDANSGGSGSGINGSDYLAKYSSFNFDIGVARNYENGWRSGVVIKNLIPQKFDFMSIGSGAVAGSAQSVTGTLNINPQFRAGVSHANTWSTVALDVDLTQNDPAGLENKSQYIALGGELSASGWAQIRAGYRMDLVNSDRNVASVGLGLSPRLPYFKPHFDIGVAGNTNEIGASMRLGLNF